MIGLLDCNNFFVSCERLFRPDLRNKPVLVLSSNDGCVVARSQEVKDLGIGMGVPYFKIKDIIKDNDITTFSSHFALYRDISRRVFETMRKYTNTVEQYSIDEAFFLVSREQAERTAQLLKDRIEQEVGIPVSVGVGRSKTQAKYASKLAKTSGGACVMMPEMWSETVDKIQLRDIWGVGRQLILEFKNYDLNTVSDILRADTAVIKNLFGVVGVHLQHELHGSDESSLSLLREPQQSLMSTRSFRETTTDIAVLQDALAHHVRHVSADLRAMNMKTSTIRMMIRPSNYSDFALQGSSVEIRLAEPTNDTFQLLKTVHELCTNAFIAGVPYKKAGVVVSQLLPESVVQQNLFATEVAPKNKELLQVLDTLNYKAGHELITVGLHTKNTNWQAKKDLASPAYTTRWSEVVSVVA